jgi:hypothetical protein
VIDRVDYAAWNYRQPAGQCVLAAYAAALWPFSRQPAGEYFQAYCRTFGVDITSRTPEEGYDADFHARAMATPGGGFGVLNLLHQCSSAPAFTVARGDAVLSFSADGARDWGQVEAALRTVPGATAEVFINDNPGSPFMGMHAIALTADGAGLYAYDSNQGLVDLPGGKSQLGVIGHTFLFTPRAP